MAQDSELVRWALMLVPDGPSTIIVVVDDSDDDELASAVAREDRVPSHNFVGAWGSSEDDGESLVVFQLIQLDGGLERQWSIENTHRQLLDAILDVPHYVSIMPAEIAGEATTLEAMVPRLGGSLIVGVEDRSTQIEQLLADWGD